MKTGVNGNLEHTPREIGNKTINKGDKKKLKFKIILFNAPFLLSIKNYIDQLFLRLVKKFFPKTN